MLTDRNVPNLKVGYAEAVADPQSTAALVNDFLGGWLNLEAMTLAVDPGLFRQKS